MFYNHEILTSRKHGVATVWLMATLGSQSSLKRVGRKAIIEVDIPKACETIMTPVAPMALRLQSSLLYGVSRVYSQQCGYVLADVQTTHTGMRQMFRAVHGKAELDQDKGKAAKPDQLILADDPNFDPNLTLGVELFDLGIPGLTTDASSQSSAISHSPPTPRFHRSSNRPLPGIVIPSSASPTGGTFEGFELGDETDMMEVGRLSGLAQGALYNVDGDGGFYPDVDFTFDAEGNIQELGASREARHRSMFPIATATSAGHMHGAEDGDQGGIVQYGGDDFDIGFDLLGDGEYPLLPDAEPFAPRRQINGEDDGGTIHDGEDQGAEGLLHAEATMGRRRARAVKILKTDRTAELRNADIAAWSRNYLDNMAKATALKSAGRRLALAKKNAEEALFGRGLGGIGSLLGPLGIDHPFNAFHGEQLRAWVMNEGVERQGQKRRREGVDYDAQDGESRPTKRRSSVQDEIGGWYDRQATYEDGFVNLGDEAELEVGRQAAASPGDIIRDHSSAMPWNIIRASHRSSAIEQGRVAAASLAGGSASSVTPLPGAFHAHRHSSRQVTPSPLMGHGSVLLEPPPRAGSTAALQMEMAEAPSSSAPGDDEAVAQFGDGQGAMAAGAGDDEFELFGPAAHVDTQTAQQSQWIRDALDRESENFFAFVQTQLWDEGLGGAGRVTFEALLPSAHNTNIVAAQGLLHSLALATKGALRVVQEDAFGDIWISVA